MLNRLIPAIQITLMLSLTALAVTINVPQDRPTIQAGINAAVDGDTVLIADGIYTGAGNVGISFGGKAIVVKSANGPGRCIVDILLNGQGFVFNTQEDTNSILEGLSIINASYSGVFFTNSASPKLLNLVIANCQSRGIAISDAECCPIIDGCLIYHNHAQDFGGGIAVFAGSPLIRNSYIIGNYGHAGGGVYTMNSQPVHFYNTYFCNNYSNEAGAFERDCSSGSWYFDNCVFANNNGTENGGCTIMWYGSGLLSIKNSTFVNNYSSGFTGLFRLGGSTSPCYLENCTFYDNVCLNGGSIISNPLSLTVKNCTFWGNSEPAFTISDSSAFTPTYSDIQGGYPGTGNFDADPLFVSEDSWDVRLQSDSPCIDAGDPASPLDPDGTVADVGSQYFDQNALARVLLNSKFRPLFVHNEGGLINIPLELENFTSTTLNSTIWLEAVPPYTTSHYDIWGPYDFSLFLFSSEFRDISQNVSASLPMGVYTCNAYATAFGDTLTDNCMIIKVDNFPEPPNPYGQESSGLAVIPDIPVLYPPYPNPCNSEFTIEFSLPEGGYVNLAVYDITGRLVETMEDSYFSAGSYTRNFTGTNFSSGIYFVKMQAGTSTDIRKLVLIK